MKKLFSLLLGMVMAAGFSTGFAEDLSPAASSMGKILQKLQNDGYVAVHKIEMEKGIYEAEVINIQGNKIDIRINPQTGEILDPKNIVMPRLTAEDALKKVESAGYSNIYKIESEDNQYEVKATDRDGKTVKLKVDAITGKMKKELF